MSIDTSGTLWTSADAGDIRGFLEAYSSDGGYPIRLRHDLPEAALEKRVTWKLTKILWIDVVAKIADAVEAEIVIGKQVVTLKQRKPVECAPSKGG